MAGTRSSPRFNRTQDTAESTETTDKKRKADDEQASPSKPAKKQQTLEQIGVKTDKTAADNQDKNDKTAATDQDMKDVAAAADADADAEDAAEGVNGSQSANGGGTSSESKSTGDMNGENNDESTKANDKSADETNGKINGGSPKANDTSTDKTTKSEQTSHTAVEKDESRADQIPSSILERGVIYFFSRGRVNVDDMKSVTDIQRSFFVLRPLPAGTKLSSGVLRDTDLKDSSTSTSTSSSSNNSSNSSNNRLLALPKKVWPRTSADKFMAFVEADASSLSDLRTSFLAGSTYTTATSGTRSQPAVTPVGEGVYALSKSASGNDTYLHYMLTIPRAGPGELQTDIGLRSRASFVLSLKNPKGSGPANAQLDEPAEFPASVMEAFRGRNWMPVEPEHLDYRHAQILMIGVDDDDAGDDADGRQKGELEKLEKEDESRVDGLAKDTAGGAGTGGSKKGDDAVFADLGLSKDEYPDVATTW